MRIVRFYLESWQKGSTPSPSASLYLLSPHIRRRQRIPKMEELEEQELCSNDDDDDSASNDNDYCDDDKATEIAAAIVNEKSSKKMKKRDRNYKFYWKSRYPPTVKKLSVLCSDVLAKHVILQTHLFFF